MITIEGLSDGSIAGQPFDAGRYRLMCTLVTPGTAKSGSGNRVLNLELTVIEHGEFDGRKMFHTITISKGAIPFTKPAVLAFGIPIENDTFNDKLFYDNPVAEAEVGIDKYIERDLETGSVTKEVLNNKVVQWVIPEQS